MQRRWERIVFRLGAENIPLLDEARKRFGLSRSAFTRNVLLSFLMRPETYEEDSARQMQSQLELVLDGQRDQRVLTAKSVGAILAALGEDRERVRQFVKKLLKDVTSDGRQDRAANS